MSTLSATTTIERRDLAARAALLRRVWSEFEEMPCLRLTDRQAQRLFGMRPDVCQRVLSQLVAQRLLAKDFQGSYRRREARTEAAQRGIRWEHHA